MPKDALSLLIFEIIFLTCPFCSMKQGNALVKSLLTFSILNLQSKLKHSKPYKWERAIFFPFRFYFVHVKGRPCGISYLILDGSHLTRSFKIYWLLRLTFYIKSAVDSLLETIEKKQKCFTEWEALTGCDVCATNWGAKINKQGLCSWTFRSLSPTFIIH